VAPDSQQSVLEGAAANTVRSQIHGKRLA